MNKTLVTEDEVKHLLSPVITKRDYDKIIDKISNRVNFIWRKICEIDKHELEWWAFKNDIEYANGNGSSGGYFDPETCMNFIELTGDWDEDNIGDVNVGVYYLYESGFPTEFLWTKDNVWMDIVKKEIEETKKLILEKKDQIRTIRKSRKEKHLDLARSIKEKLTRDELKFIKTQLTRQEQELLS